MKNLTQFINESLQLPQNMQQVIDAAISLGYIEYDGEKYGVSLENIHSLEFEEKYREQALKYINQCIKSKKPFKFQTDAEWKKAKYKDPNE